MKNYHLEIYMVIIVGSVRVSFLTGLSMYSSLVELTHETYCSKII